MTLVGLWHGASTNFVLFGMLHGVLIGIWYALVGTGRRLGPRQRIISWALFQVVLMFSMTMFRADTLGGAFEMIRAALIGGAGTADVNDALVGLGLSGAAVYMFQRFELRPSRRLARFRSNLVLFPVFLMLILVVLYMKGLTLEGVWISPGDPFFNQGQEKFIYLKF